MSVFGGKKEKALYYIKDARSYGIDILPPDINKSTDQFSIEGDAIRFGLSAIAQFGEGSIEEVVAQRPFATMQDFVDRVPKKKANKRVIEALCLSGAMDEMMPNAENRMDIFQELSYMRGDYTDYSVEIAKFDSRRKAEAEHKYLNVYITGHPLSEYADPVDWDSINIDEMVTTSGIITEVKHTKTRKKQEDMAILEMSFPETDETVVIFPQTFAKIGVKLVKDLVVRVQLKLTYNTMRDEYSWIAEKVFVPKRMNGELYQELNPKQEGTHDELQEIR